MEKLKGFIGGLVLGISLIAVAHAQSTCANKIWVSDIAESSKKVLNTQVFNKCQNIYDSDTLKGTFIPAQSTPPPAPAPSPTPTPTPPPPNPQPAGLPHDVVGVNWRVDSPLVPAEPGKDGVERYPILQAEKDDRYKPYLYLDTDGGAVFRAPVVGRTTSSSTKYVRTELREATNSTGTEAKWSNQDGRAHVLEGEYSITHTLTKRKQVVFAQIHGGSDDVLQLALNDNQLVLFYNEKKSVVTLEPNYVLGTKFKATISAVGSRVKIYYNNVQKADISKSGTTWYFKAGSYPQSNVNDWGESSSATATVTIYSLKVLHE